MSINDKLYSTLGPAARVVAVVSAMSRRDDAETTRLMDTAPMATYKAHDLEFWRFLHCAERMALHTALFIEPAVTLYVSRLASLGILVHQDGGAFDVEAAERLVEAANEAVANIKAYWTAYTTTCADIGLEPVELLASVGAALSPTAKMLTGKDVEPEPELFASASALMRQLAGRE
ncbi:hypothetical protein THIX_20482 [Thiomonas sp. X19]|uniref:hypothetical protein n=1 Tax=Thiomonas sp. X19 TaxID=1050370 RepID=UPI000B703CAC|nr:hypothetical protein [Thiomonas sp. X19]SCC92432.1 hypothetical protein THIX_20482 [Thiomonas sp. X19]